MNFEAHAKFFTRARHQRILRAGNVRPAHSTSALDRNPHPALSEFIAARTSRAQTESALAPFQVRHTHAGEQHPGEFLRRKSYGHANHGAENTRLAQPMPERRSAPHPFNSGSAERHRVFANLPAPLWSFDLRRRKVRQVVAEIPRQKIIDIVLARIHSSHKGRPSYWRNGGVRSPQFSEGPLLAQLRQVRQPAFCDESLGQFRIHTVEAENDRAFDLSLPVCLAPAQNAK